MSSCFSFAMPQPESATPPMHHDRFPGLRFQLRPHTYGPASVNLIACRPDFNRICRTRNESPTRRVRNSVSRRRSAPASWTAPYWITIRSGVHAVAGRERQRVKFRRRASILEKSRNIVKILSNDSPTCEWRSAQSLWSSERFVASSNRPC